MKIAKPLGWMLLAGTWLFLVAALGSFDSADWPSHAVAEHNQPMRNLCGVIGSVIAYNGYFVLGTGSWVVLAGLAGFLWLTGRGHRVPHPFVRALGLLVMAIAASGFHALLFPSVGSLAGANAGLLATAIVGELGTRFHGFGTFIVLLAMLGIGSVVAMDQVVRALPYVIVRTARGAGAAAVKTVAAVQVAAATVRRAGGTNGMLELKPPKKRERATKSVEFRGGGGIDPDAGGIGATDSFDPDEYEVFEGELEELEEDAEGVEDSAPAPQRRRGLTRDELAAKIARLPLRLAGASKAVARDEDIPREPDTTFEGYQFPTLELLEDPEHNFSQRMEAFVRQQAQKLEEAMQTYGIDGEVVGIESGPVVTLYSVQLAPGTRVARVQAVDSDIARALQAQNIRLVPNQAGKTTIGIEVPNLHKEKVRLKELMSGGQSEGMVLPMFLGKDASGEPLVADLTRMPHMLIAGTTGSGKSVCINTILMSWLYTKRPDELKLILVDPKMVEMGQFQDIPHLMCPIVTEMARAVAILEWAVNKMEERYELLREAAVRHVTAYNQLSEEELYERFQPASDLERARIPKKLPFIVIIIDELADLIMTHKEVEHSIVRIAQKARAVGIHLILATQRPQANVVTGLIKSNMPCRVAFKVSSGMDSRIVLDQKGADLLLGQGDMLFLTPHTSEVKRSQGTLVTDGEIRKVAKFLKTVAAPTFERSLIAIRPGAQGGDGEEGEGAEGERDPMFDEAVRIMIETGRGSVSLLQRRLAIGYSRASRLVDQMALAGILGEHKGSVAREVLITLEEWEQMKAMEEAAQSGEELFEEGEAPEQIAEDSTSDDEPVPDEYADEYRG